MARGFDGSADYLTAGTLPLLAGVSRAALSAWLYRAAAGTAATVGLTGTPYRFLILWFTDDNVYVAIENGATAFWSFSSSASGWHHFVVNYDGSINDPTVYLDGAAQSVAIGGAAMPPTLASTANQGPWQWGYDGSAFYPGRSADTALWPDANLSDGEAKRLFLGEHPSRVRPGRLAHHWPFAAGGGWEPDLSTWQGSARHATVAGGAPTLHEGPAAAAAPARQVPPWRFGTPPAAGKSRPPYRRSWRFFGRRAAS